MPIRRLTLQISGSLAHQPPPPGARAPKRRFNYCPTTSNLCSSIYDCRKPLLVDVRGITLVTFHALLREGTAAERGHLGGLDTSHSKAHHTTHSPHIPIPPKVTAAPLFRYTSIQQDRETVELLSYIFVSRPTTSTIEQLTTAVDLPVQELLHQPVEGCLSG